MPKKQTTNVQRSFQNIKQSLNTMVLQKEKLIPLVFVAAFLIAGGMAAYFYSQLVELRKNPQETAQKEAQQIIEKVARLIVLPEGETPTIATVTDPERLKEQAFFSRSEKGDRVLIYTTAKKAILYRPSTDKIVEVAPLNIGTNQEGTEQITP